MPAEPQSRETTSEPKSPSSGWPWRENFASLAVSAAFVVVLAGLTGLVAWLIAIDFPQISLACGRWAVFFWYVALGLAVISLSQPYWKWLRRSEMH